VTVQDPSSSTGQVSRDLSAEGEIGVECYSGHTYAQEPRVVIWQGHRHAVAQVVARWRTPEGPTFQVRTETGEWFQLHYLESDDQWAIQPAPPGRELGSRGAEIIDFPSEGQRSRDKGEREPG
jgi:hypothetical protein